MFRKSYLIVAVATILAVIAVDSAKSQSLFLDPSEVYITNGTGQEFDLVLRADAAVTDLRTYVFYVWFDTTKLDTVSITEGPLLGSTGGTTVFNKYISGDSVLQLEGLVLGAGVSVAGPGELATVRLRTKDTGIVDLGMFYHETRDVNNDQFASSASGAMIYVNVPPAEFNLVEPIGGNTVTGFPGENFDLVWESSSSVYLGEGVTYTLDYGTSPTFQPAQTLTLTGLTDTTHTLFVDDLTNGMYYWRVTAVGDVNGFERNSAEESFEFAFGLVEPEAFDLAAPADSVKIDIYQKASIPFSWDPASTIIPDDTIHYEFYLGPNPSLPTGAVISELNLLSPEYNLAAIDAPLAEWDFWRVNAVNTYDLNTWSTSTRAVMFYSLGDVNSDRNVDVGDLTEMIAFLFLSGPAPFPIEAGNADCIGSVDVGDLTQLINFLFLGGSLDPCS